MSERKKRNEIRRDLGGRIGLMYVSKAGEGRFDVHLDLNKFMHELTSEDKHITQREGKRRKYKMPALPAI